MGDSTISLIDFIELPCDWIKAAILAEYDVYMKKKVKNSTKSTTRLASKFDLKGVPKNTIGFRY